MPKRQRSRPADRPSVKPNEETRATEAMTAIWVLAVLNTLVCLLVSMGAQAYFHWNPGQVAALFFARWMLLAAAVVGLLVLCLTLVVRRVRKAPPPVGVTIFAVLVGLTPLVALAIVIAIE